LARVLAPFPLARDRNRSRDDAADQPGILAAIAAAKAFGNIPERNASHIEVFNLTLGGTPDAALDLVRRHLSTWPRDAFIAAIAANQNGLVGPRWTGAEPVGLSRRPRAALQ
jgi:hypothetical protein